jgi:hypothetical protein
VRQTCCLRLNADRLEITPAFTVDSRFCHACFMRRSSRQHPKFKRWNSTAFPG